MSQFKLLLKGSALRTLEAVVAIVVGFITLPLMNAHLGTELYGLWVLIGSVTAMMYLFDMGFASAVTQKIAYSISQKDHLAANRVISTALVIYTGLALIIAAVVLAAAFFYKPDLKGLVDANEFRWVLILAGLAIAFEFPAKAFAGLAQAHFRHDLVALYRIFFRIVSTVAIIVFLYMGYKIVAIAIINLVFSLLSTVAFTLVGRYIYRQMEISPRLVNRQVFKELFGYSAWAFLIDLNRALKSRIDLFFIGAYISLSAVTTYYVAIRLIDYTTELLHKMLSITLPTFTAHLAADNKQAFREDLLLFNRINTYAYALALIFFLVVGKSIIYYWLGSDFDFNAAYAILLVVAVGRISVVAVDGYITSLYAKNMHKVMVASGLAETAVTAILLYVFLANLGYGPLYAAISISAPIILFRFLFLPYLCFKPLQLPRYGQLVWMSYRPLILFVICAAVHLLSGINDARLGYPKIIEILVIGLICLVFITIESQPREKALAKKLLSKILSPVSRRWQGEK